MAKYRKKPVVIEAHVFPGVGVELLPEMQAFDDWISRAYVPASGRGLRAPFYRGDKLIIPTLEGDMEARPGDFVIVGVQGEIYPCKPDIFAQTYEPAE